MRLVILGDPHIVADEIPLWDQAVEDINRLSPDAVFILGDLSGPPNMGSHSALARAVSVLDRLTPPWYSIIGNHDLESPTFDSDGAAVADWLKQIGRNTPWFSHDMGILSVIGLSNTQWRTNPGERNEIVLNAKQLTWWREELKRLVDRPVLVLCHAPTTGSGVLTLAEHHCQFGNAYVNENHMPGDVQRVVHEHPNVLFWFSGHNHMGQHYRDAVTMRQGVHYVHTGVVSRQYSRDGRRHSRVLDIDEDGIIVRTFDHVRRCLDEACEHREPYSLGDFMNYRRTILGKRMVPRDPATMRQGPGQVRSFDSVRFAFLNDAHLVHPINASQQRILDWCIQQIKDHAADRIVFGGDMTHHDDPTEITEALDHFFAGSLPIDYLPGNNEGPKFQIVGEHPVAVRMIAGCQGGGDGWPECTFLLQTTNVDDAAASVEQLIARWPGQGNIMVLAHFPPKLAGGAVERAASARPDQQIWWICGHQHADERIDQQNLHVIVSGGLDPIKVHEQMPSMLIIDWDGHDPMIQHHHLPETFLNSPRGRTHPVGLAYRGVAEDIIHTAVDHEITCLQFHYQFSQGEPTRQALNAIHDFRRRVSDGFLSLHLPAFSDGPQGPTSPELTTSLQWAKTAHVDDLTIYLPDVPAGRVFDAHRQWRPSPWVRACQDAYLALAEQTLAIGSQLSLKNLYNAQRVEPDEEKLSSRPWHLIKFVQWLREILEGKGYPPEQVQRIGIIFDTGHAFCDATVAKVHGLADWIHHVGPYLQLAHIHQVGINGNGKITNHHPITDRLGPMINYVGVLAAIGDVARRPVPLLIEVRDRQEALASWRTLTTEQGTSV